MLCAVRPEEEEEEGRARAEELGFCEFSSVLVSTRQMGWTRGEEDLDWMNRVRGPEGISCGPD